MYKKWPYQKNKPQSVKFDQFLDYMKAHSFVALRADILTDLATTEEEVARMVRFGGMHRFRFVGEVDEDGGEWLRLAERAKEGGACRTFEKPVAKGFEV